jgi:hypothetical protein
MLPVHTLMIEGRSLRISIACAVTTLVSLKSALFAFLWCVIPLAVRTRLPLITITPRHLAVTVCV